MDRPVVAQVVRDAALPPERPAGLIVVCVLVLITGGLGLAGSAWGAINVAAQGAWTAPVPAAANESDEARAMRRMQERLYESSVRYRVPTIAIYCGNLLLSAAMVVLGTRALLLKPDAGRHLRGVLLAAMVFAAVSTATSMAIQWANRAIMEDSMRAAMGKDAQRQPEFVALMVTIMLAVMLGVAALWGLAKLALYFFSFRYLGRPDVQQLFRPVRPPMGAPER